MFFHHRASIRRRICDALLAAVSVLAVALIILAIDGRAGDQMTRFVATHIAGGGGMAVHLHDSATHATRSAWELSHLYGPLMTFAGVALVLVVFMLRTK